jgi:GAF domain-containing protein
MASSAIYVDEQQEMLAVSNLANLYTMTDQLFGVRGRKQVLESIHSIASTLSGADEIAIFEFDAARDRLIMVAVAGMETNGLNSIPLGTGLIGRSAADGEIYERFFDPDATLAGERYLRACIPLRMDRTLIGAVAIFDSSGKHFLQPPLNREWVEIFATHAATAMHWTS